MLPSSSWWISSKHIIIKIILMMMLLMMRYMYSFIVVLDGFVVLGVVQRQSVLHIYIYHFCLLNVLG
jgi:hypothetical protein